MGPGSVQLSRVGPPHWPLAFPVSRDEPVGSNREPCEEKRGKFARSVDEGTSPPWAITGWYPGCDASGRERGTPAIRGNRQAQPGLVGGVFHTGKPAGCMARWQSR